MSSMVDPNLSSFIPVPAESHFPIQNLPYGVFRPHARGEPRVGVAIGEWILDLSVLEAHGLLKLPPGNDKPLFNRSSLNAFMALGKAAWQEAREIISRLLQADNPTLRDDRKLRDETLVPISDVELLLPVEIGDYTDFYSSREHATNVGTLVRGPQNALPPNWLHMPVAYHGRASSVVVSGTDIRRPQGQRLPDGDGPPVFGSSRALDFELEIGFFMGTGNRLGEPLPASQAWEHLFGLVLLNDWSARDIQKWEYQPLGPFLAKNFATSISPWVVPLAALEPFRTPGPVQDPLPLPYLQTPENTTFDLRLEAALQTPGMSSPVRICATNLRYVYWNICQQVAHHTITGCNLRTGDLLATGTLSGPEREMRACLLELTWGGQEPLKLPGGEIRRFLEDGDRLTLTGWCQGAGYRVGFGEVTGRLLPA